MRAGDRFLQLKAIAVGDRTAATSRVRDAFAEAGAWITDVRFFSGVQSVFVFEMESSGRLALRDALTKAGLELDAASLAALEPAPAISGDVGGTLVVLFRDGDPDLRRDVPAVPG
jgi:hypothetical protein